MRSQVKRDTKSGWLLFFYSVPTKPAAGRIKIWRRLQKAGAVQFKGAVYALPYTEEHYELFQWLVSEVASMKGEAAFVRVDRVETMKDEDLVAIFRRQKEEGYRVIGEGLEGLERKIATVRNASGALSDDLLSVQLGKYIKAFEEIRKTDFFASEAGSNLRKKIKAIEAEISHLTGTSAKKKEGQVIPRRIEEYQGRTWVTRKRPFIDRMATAWLVRRFVDRGARFKFIDEGDAEGLGDSVVFDMRGGEFTHVGDLCTFEVVVKSFGLKDKALKAVAEIVHELDVKDERYSRPEAEGVEGILTGIRKTAADDMDALEKGMAVFEMLYASKS